MKIAFLTPEYPHPAMGASGGIGTSIRNLALALAEKGHQPVVLVYGQQKDDFFEEDGICFYQIRNVKFKGLSWFFTRKKLQRLIDRLYASKSIDVVEAPDWTGITSFIAPAACPVVIRIHGSDTYFCHLDGRPVKWQNRFHEKRALEKADNILSVSRFAAELTNRVFGIDKSISVIPNGIDTRFFNPSSNPSNPDTILYFGSLIRKKGLLELPLIFNKVIENNPQARLILAGRDVPDAISGNASTWAMMQPLFSEAADGKVQFTGPIPYDEIRNYIESAAVCVFPSFAEALPVSWLEAMAMEKAVVASDIGWSREIITDGGDGFLVSPKDHVLYAQKINQLLQDAQLRESLGKMARVKISGRFDSELVTRQNISFYQKIIASK